VKALVTLGIERAPGLEKLPTAQEEGIAGLDCGSWGAFMVPKGTPDAIVRRLARATNETLDTPAVRERLLNLGVTIMAPERRGPEFLAKFIPAETARMAPPIKASGISID